MTILPHSEKTPKDLFKQITAKPDYEKILNEFVAHYKLTHKEADFKIELILVNEILLGNDKVSGHVTFQKTDGFKLTRYFEESATIFENSDTVNEMYRDLLFNVLSAGILKLDEFNNEFKKQP